jgi:3-ketosteroid 9alpha-monooxygenase subunit B
MQQRRSGGGVTVSAPRPGSTLSGAGTNTARERRFHRLTVGRVVRETADAVSLVLTVPDELREQYAYRAGQFVTFRVRLDDEDLYRSYSMSSSPALGEALQVTVKRVPGGRVSTWMVEQLAAGDGLDVSVPSGSFVLSDEDDDERDVVAFAGGSGITPLLSLAKTVLAGSRRRVRLFYANRDADSVIFDAQLRDLAATHGDRLEVVHHLDSVQGLVTEDRLAGFATGGAEHFVCGPEPFMDLAERTLQRSGVPAEQIRLERFGSVEPAVDDPDAPPPVPADTAPTGTTVTVKMGRKTATGAHRAGSTILQTARSFGLKPPSSCEAGTCATCIARVTEGAAQMRNNEVLEPDEVEDGYVLTCQAVPTTESVTVDYE